MRNFFCFNKIVDKELLFIHLLAVGFPTCLILERNSLPEGGRLCRTNLFICNYCFRKITDPWRSLCSPTMNPDRLWPLELRTKTFCVRNNYQSTASGKTIQLIEEHYSCRFMASFGTRIKYVLHKQRCGDDNFIII